MYEDPVREAFDRWLARTPELERARRLDADTEGFLRHLRTCLTAADCAMQDEGLDHQARRRVISAALYGSAGEEERAERRLKENDQLQRVMEDRYSRPMTFGPFPADLLDGLPPFEGLGGNPPG